MPIGGRGDEYGRRLAGSLVVFCLVALGCCAAVTQYVAAHFDYATALGPEWGHHVYPPLNWLAWNIKFHSADPPFWTAIDIAFAAVLAVAGLVSGIWVSTGTRRLVAGEGIHGTARFLSTLAEARAAGVAPPDKPGDRAGFSSHALYLATVTDGQGRTFYLRQDGNEHLAVIAPTRVGKGIGPVLMNALSWPDAWIAYDPKGELYQFSGGYRATLGPVWRWDPVGHGPGYARYNMLDSVRLRTIHEVGDTMDIATLLIDPSSKGDWDHWQSTAFALLTAVILYVLYENYAKGRRAALADVLAALSEQDTLYRRMVENQFGEPKLDGGFTGGRHEGIGRPADQQANRDPRERNGVHSTAVKSLVLFSDPLIAANTASSSFRIEDIWNGPLPGSLYITVGPSEELKLQPLLRMMLTLLLRAAQRPRLENENGQPKRPWRHRTLMMLDEFASLGRIKEIPLALSRIAGYGVQLALIIQDMSQIFDDEAYGRNETITGNVRTKIVYSPNEIATAEWLSRQCGQATIIKMDRSLSGGRFASVLNHVSENYRETERPLITAEETMRLRPPEKDVEGRVRAGGEVILLRTGHQPFLATQLMYFLDSVFLERARLPPPHLAEAP